MHNRATVYSSHTPLRRSTTAAERHRPKEATLLIRINVERTQQRSPCTQVWKVAVGFQHNELLVSASNAVLEDGTTLPAAVGNGTVFAGFPQTDLKTAVETAGDLKQMQAQISLVGTVFLCGAAGCSIAVIDQAC